MLKFEFNFTGFILRERSIKQRKIVKVNYMNLAGNANRETI